MPADFKGPPRVENRLATTEACLRWRTCPCGKPSANGHHVLAKGPPYFGDDVVENIVPLCGSGTTGCHGEVENEDHDALVMLGDHILWSRPDTVYYLSTKLGGPDRAMAWLERRLHV